MIFNAMEELFPERKRTIDKIRKLDGPPEKIELLAHWYAAPETVVEKLSVYGPVELAGDSIVISWLPHTEVLSQVNFILSFISALIERDCGEKVEFIKQDYWWQCVKKKIERRDPRKANPEELLEFQERLDRDMERIKKGV